MNTAVLLVMIMLAAALQELQALSWRLPSISLKRGNTRILSQTTPVTGPVDDTMNQLSLIPCGDDLDWKIAKLMMPAVVNYAIMPLVGAIDTFWIAKLHNALATAGQGTANQVYASIFWTSSFLPSVITPLVAKAHGKKDIASVQARAGEAIFVATVVGTIATIAFSFFTDRILTIGVKTTSPSWHFARSFLRVRALTFLPSLLNVVGFALFRGSLDVVTPLRISLFANIINVLLDPIFMFKLGMGVSGAAAATCVADLLAFSIYAYLLFKRKMISLSSLAKIPSRSALGSLLWGGLSIQIKSIALNTAMIAVSRRTQALDGKGVYAAAHVIAMQMFHLGSVVSLALSTVASMVVPTERTRLLSLSNPENIPLDGSNAHAQEENRRRAMRATRQVTNRILAWSVALGLAIGGLQLMMLPMLSLFSPLPSVQDAAKIPTTIGAVLQVMNCIIWTGEGIQQGSECFGYITAVSLLATGSMLLALMVAPDSLVGIWTCFGVLASVRLIGMLLHYFILGPLAPRNIQSQDHCKTD